MEGSKSHWSTRPVALVAVLALATLIIRWVMIGVSVLINRFSGEAEASSAFLYCVSFGVTALSLLLYAAVFVVIRGLQARHGLTDAATFKANWSVLAGVALYAVYLVLEVLLHPGEQASAWPTYALYPLNMLSAAVGVGLVLPVLLGRMKPVAAAALLAAVFALVVEVVTVLSSVVLSGVQENVATFVAIVTSAMLNLFAVYALGAALWLAARRSIAGAWALLAAANGFLLLISGALAQVGAGQWMPLVDVAVAAASLAAVALLSRTRQPGWFREDCKRLLALIRQTP